jgi:hypothetical protein
MKEETEWFDKSTAPKDIEFIGVDSEGEERLMHFAQDLSGEEQPPFSGFFYKAGSGTCLPVSFIKWRPQKSTD